MIDLWIYGTGALAEKIFHYNERDKQYNIVGFIDDNKQEKLFCGLPVLNYSEFKEQNKSNTCKIFIAIGYVKCNQYRKKVFDKVKKDSFKLINYVSPNSICFKDVLKGDNILVCDNVFIGHGSIIGDGVILSVGCTLSHENTIESFSFISSCVAFGGHSTIKNNCFIGIHSTIKDGITIGEYNIVGSGTNVLNSTEPYCLTIGNPGKTKSCDTLNISI